MSIFDDTSASDSSSQCRFKPRRIGLTCLGERLKVNEQRCPVRVLVPKVEDAEPEAKIVEKRRQYGNDLITGSYN